MTSKQNQKNKALAVAAQELVNQAQLDFNKSYSIKISETEDKKKERKISILETDEQQTDEQPTEYYPGQQLPLINKEYTLISYSNYLILQPNNSTSDQKILLKLPQATSPSYYENSEFSKLINAYQLVTPICHQNIVPVLATKFEERQSEDGLSSNFSCIAMPHCGSPLSQLEPPDTENRYDLFQQFLSALCCLDRESIYNPDANPKNCVVKFDENNQCYCLTLIDLDGCMNKPEESTNLSPGEVSVSSHYTPKNLKQLTFDQLRNYTIALSFIQIRLWLFSEQGLGTFEQIKEKIDTLLQKKNPIIKPLNEILNEKLEKDEIELIASLLKPFEGKASIKSTTYQLVFEKLNKIYTAHLHSSSCSMKKLAGQKQNTLQSLQNACLREQKLLPLFAALGSRKQELEKEQNDRLHQFVNFFTTRLPCRFSESYSTHSKILAIQELKKCLGGTGSILKKRHKKILTQGRTADCLKQFKTLPEIQELLDWRQKYDKRKLGKSPRYWGHYNSLGKQDEPFNDQTTLTQ